VTTANEIAALQGFNIRLWQGWANYGPRPAGTCRNSYACRIYLWNIYYFHKNL